MGDGVTSEPERVTLRFLCVHDRGDVNLRKVDSRQRLREYAAAQGWTLQEDRALSWMAHLAYKYNATLSYDVDQWFRAIATVDRYDVEQKPLVEEFVVTVQCMPPLSVRLVEDPREVERIAGRWLVEHRVEANHAATLLGADLRGAVAGAPPRLAWALALRGDDLVALGVHSPQGQARLAAADTQTALAVAEAWSSARHTLVAVTGEVQPSAAFAHRWEELAGVRARIGMREGLHVLDGFVPATGVPGRARQVEARDVDLVVRWLRDFHSEALPHLPPIDVTTARERMENGAFLVWEDGEPVSLAGFRTAVGVGRVGPVWTPPYRRRCRYAAAVTTAATRAILDAGAAPVLLTNLENPTSNAVYARLGYRMISESTGWIFEAG